MYPEILSIIWNIFSCPIYYAELRYWSSSRHNKELKNEMSGLRSALTAEMLQAGYDTGIVSRIQK